MVRQTILIVANLIVFGAVGAAAAPTECGKMFVLNAETFRHHVDLFNTMEPENIVNHISNDKSWEWMKENVPFFECPDKRFEQVYYFGCT